METTYASNVYTSNKTLHYPLTLKATYTCCTGKHTFWYNTAMAGQNDFMAEQRIDYSHHMTIEEAIKEFCQTHIALGGKLDLATDPITSRKITKFFGEKLGKKRKIPLELRVIQFEPEVPLLTDAELLAA